MPYNKVRCTLCAYNTTRPASLGRHINTQRHRDMLDSLHITNEDTQPYVNADGSPLTQHQAKELRVQLYFMKLKHVPVTPDIFNQELQQMEQDKIALCRSLINYVIEKETQ